MRQVTVLLVFCAAAALAIVACSKKEGSAPVGGDPAGGSPMGVGPIQQKVGLEAINPPLAAAGKKVFDEKCSACHKIGEKYVGPDLKGVTQRRAPEWVMNMILNPQEMTQKDPVAKELLGTFLTQMTFQNVSQEDARALLEFFRQNDGK